MSTLVTEGTGFLGERLIPHLARDGHHVLALAGSTSSHGQLRALGASPVAGDLERGRPLTLPAIDAVVHAAAYVRFAGLRAPYFRTNVDGTAALLEAAVRTPSST